MIISKSKEVTQMNKTAIITGGATGIGSAISSLLCQNRYNVVVAFNTSEEKAITLINSLNNGGNNAIPFKVDVTDKSQVNNLFDTAIKTFGKVDLLVSNAGIAQQKLFTDITENDWNNMLAVNLTGCFNCCQTATELMLKNHNGCIINISSMWGLVGASCEVHYSASKAGVIGLTKALAKELGPSGIRVNCIAPGVIKTDMLRGFSDIDLNELACETPLGRLGTPKDIAEAVLFLASENASFITGQVLSVDGGFII